MIAVCRFVTGIVRVCVVVALKDLVMLTTRVGVVVVNVVRVI